MSLDPTNIKSSHQAHVGHNEDHSGVDSDSEVGQMMKVNPIGQAVTPQLNIKMLLPQ